jgi:hypothetical protein
MGASNENRFSPSGDCGDGGCLSVMMEKHPIKVGMSHAS